MSMSYVTFFNRRVTNENECSACPKVMGANLSSSLVTQGTAVTFD